jgi:hypothetical protein
MRVSLARSPDEAAVASHISSSAMYLAFIDDSRSCNIFAYRNNLEHLQFTL